MKSDFDNKCFILVTNFLSKMMQRGI